MRLLRNLEIIGEAARYFWHGPQQHYPTVDWVSARAMPNAVVHGYEGVRDAIVRRTVCDDVPSLQAALPEVAIRYKE